MALTRKFLTALGIEADKVDEIINAHAETVDALKAERDTYKDKAEKFDAEQDKVTKLEKQVKDLEDSNKDSYKVKYEAIKEEFADYKKGIESEKSKAEKTNAFKALLKEIGISEKRIDSVTKISDIDGIKLDKDGKIEGVDELKKSLSEEWSDFIEKTGTQGASTATPPAGGNGGGAVKTKEEILKIKDTSERQAAWKEYMNNGGK
jgi:molecular chaperone GrpE (heat shock protein)